VLRIRNTPSSVSSSPSSAPAIGRIVPIIRRLDRLSFAVSTCCFTVAGLKARLACVSVSTSVPAASR